MSPSQPNQLFILAQAVLVDVTIISSNLKHSLKKDKGNYMSILSKLTIDLCGIGEKGAGV